MNYVRTFEQCNVNDVNLVGGKGANLGEMTRAKLPVPPGFSLTADAYRAFIRAADAQSTIARALAGLSIDDTLRVEKQTQIIRDFLIAQEMPRDIAAQALASYRALAKELGGRASAIIPVAVRSSATAEDLPTASFAGQQDTYLNIRGDAELLAHVKQCWASLWTARAVTYRVKQKFDHDLVALAVVVQAMIDSEVAGILFTANPVNGNRDQVVINASWGLGEAIVSGMVNPDTVTLDKRDGKILSRAIGAKEREIKYAPNGGTVELEIESARRNLPALNDAQLFELARVSERIEAHYKMPMDIEWAFANGKFFILQARPITTLSGQPQELPLQNRGEYNRTMFIEIFPDPLSPIFLSVIAPLFHSMLDFTFQTLGFKSARAIPAIGVFHHQPYFHREYIAGALKPLSAPVRERLVAQIVNPFGHQARGMHGEFSRAYLGLVIRLIRFMTAFPKKLPGLIAEYRARINAVNALELQGLRDAEIVAQVRALTLRDASRLLNYDFLMIALIGITYQMLGTLLEKYFPADNEEVRAKLISGVTGNVTMETNKR
ncbi:MAG: hypothetical protein HY257_11885, partial [Chloroflexi bacterium]|nr:hypothetical protein [Chloroflexota bacterium]